jgi:NAD(P)-dependent dehydrogenase (short-subunit alcohol dehydrogenase family)
MVGTEYENRVALLTGGAGAICAAIARGLVAGGADVVIADVDSGRTEALASELSESGRKVVPVVADLRTAAGMQDVFDAVEGSFGHVDILVNGLGEFLETNGPFEDSTEEQWQGLYEVNLLHVFRATHRYIPGMKERGWGRIISFSSVEGIRSAPALAVYTAFKAAIDAFTKSIGVDLARFGIYANAIAVDKTRAYQVNHYALPPEWERMIPTWIPAGRYAEPEEVAEIALFLASERCTWIVGQTISADGGTTAAGGWFRTPKRWTNQPLLLQYFDEDPSVNDTRPPSVQ